MRNGAGTNARCSKRATTWGAGKRSAFHPGVSQTAPRGAQTPDGCWRRPRPRGSPRRAGRVCWPRAGLGSSARLPGCCSHGAPRGPEGAVSPPGVDRRPGVVLLNTAGNAQGCGASPTPHPHPAPRTQHTRRATAGSQSLPRPLADIQSHKDRHIRGQ